MPQNDPSPEEIAQRCKAVRDGWTPAQEARRRAWDESPAETPVVRLLGTERDPVDA